MYLIGNSTDIHKIEEKENIVEQKLAGINILTRYKVIAHSDGDIILHAIAESILGAKCFGEAWTWASGLWPYVLSLLVKELTR